MHSAINKPMLGFDEQGEVYDLGHVVYRKIRGEYKPDVAQLHIRYRESDLAAKGIVETTLRTDGDLEHRRLVTSYPYEWPAAMYKKAVLFHLRLFLELEKAGLTLKDSLPNNIVFDHTTPVFVDFLSLLPLEKLRDEAWLGAKHYGDARFAVLQRMLLPYMVLPLLFMARRDYGTARDLLSTRSCNCAGKPPSWRELARPAGGRNLAALGRYARALSVAARLLPLRLNASRRTAFATDIERLIRLVDALDVTPPMSGYVSYYDEKKEALTLSDPSAFLPKQKAVYETITARRPATVLDIGANTGWYSLLAASLGASVIALEEDECCVDILYDRASRQRLTILPLKLSFGQLTAEIYGAADLGELYEQRGVSRYPLYRAAADRLGAELVLVLGLVHHLVLGEGRRLDEVFEVLAKMTKQTLVLEFVALDDEKILGEPGFFRNLHKSDASTYSLDRAIEAGRRHFTTVTMLPSHPASRSILVFEK